MNESDAVNSGDLAQDNQIDLTCDEFERAWLRGSSPRIEDFLHGYAGSGRQRLLAELLLTERELRIRKGERATREEYQQRFPEYSTVIASLDFATIDERRSSWPTRAWSARTAGNKLAHFELIEELGAGASGTVWKARDKRLQRDVAIKIPRQDSLSKEGRDRFLHEGQAAAQLRHPNIVAIYEVGEDQSQVFIVSEFVDGLNLRDWLRVHRPTTRDAAKLIAQLAEALNYAHDQGVIHRDLKPANVLIDCDGRPLVTDFGLAKWTASSTHLTVAGNILGTPAYMSPEQARGESAQVDRRSDVYGLGTLFYEMLVGSAPFDGDLAAIVHQVIHVEPRPLRTVNSHVPRDLETICLKAMDKDPMRRYLSANELAVDLRRFLRGDAILARRVSWFGLVWRWCRRRPAAATSIVLAVAMLGSLVTINNFASKNRELLGLRLVTISTNPTGAKLAFVPLSKTTGEPQLPKATYAMGKTPLEVELAPGDYLVISDLPDGRFHEVFRHVPDIDEELPGARDQRSWKRGTNNGIALPTIKIPSRDITQNMALIDGANAFKMGLAGSTTIPVHLESVHSFYVDTTEFTYGDYLKMNGTIPLQIEMKTVSDKNRAMPATYSLALALAEDEGKRLPTEAEYEYMATARGRSNYPWGDTFPQSSAQAEFGPTGEPSFDRLNATPPVLGLCSNLAEWTTSWVVPYPTVPSTAEVITLKEQRIVRGGCENTIQGDPLITPETRNPRQRHGALIFHNYPGIGFRCVRSEKPLVEYSDFP
jgi:formylglycine-generating enzyme required for sulfatase activity/tRNA A-37 threonylcarbamoyl transferase component Bud32